MELKLIAYLLMTDPEQLNKTLRQKTSNIRKRAERLCNRINNLLIRSIFRIKILKFKTVENYCC